jgi:signal transduction histidine kinase/ActR/RegA family two-component response regulator
MFKSKDNVELVVKQIDDNNLADNIVIAEKNNGSSTDELIIANRENRYLVKELLIAEQERINRAEELVIANEEKSDRAEELVIANEEKSDRADELIIANEEKSDRAQELIVANKELAFQNQEKDKRAVELVIANKELAFQNQEKDKQAGELAIANNEKVFLLQKLQLSQKMEALGKLTGGISHEYNNMLGIISGYCELIKLTVIDNPKLTEYADEIQHACNRAAKLTGKLLACSKEKSTKASAVDVNMLLKRQHDMLQKTLTISVILIYKLHDDLWQVWLDKSDMEDAILNLCINAMHAMNEHGKLTIETKNEKISQKRAKRLNITPGKYVLLRFTDSGCGFDEKIKEKIFDPFFTTKGEFGTGLGLSIVYSFVRNSGGSVDVRSVEGKGAQFSFYFPRHSNALVDIESNKPVAYKNLGKKGVSVLLVDDEPSLLSVTSKILSASGYTVFCAQNASEALRVLKQECINILISDVIMPECDGYELAKVVKEKYPDIKIQLISGFAGSQNIHMVDVSLRDNILQKPLSSESLLSRITQLTEQTDTST